MLAENLALTAAKLCVKRKFRYFKIKKNILKCVYKYNNKLN